MPTHIDTIDEVLRRIEEVKRRSDAAEAPTKEFQYDRDEPLHLVPETETNDAVGE